MRLRFRVSSCILGMVLVLLSGRTFASESPDAVAIGPTGGWISALASSPSYDADGKLWVGAFAGKVFAGTESSSRIRWRASPAGETDPVVEGLAASPNFTMDSTVLAAADEGVFKSTDGGGTWLTSSSGLGHHFCRALAFSSNFSVDRTVYVASDGGVYRSTDGGSTWAQPTNDTRAVIALALGPGVAGTDTLYAGLDAGGMERSVDGGRHWDDIPGFSTSRRVLAVLASTDSGSSQIVAATDDGIWRSTDGAETWSLTGAGGDRVDALAAEASSSAQRVLYAGSAGGSGVYASTDGGGTWTRAGAPDMPFVTTLAMAGASTLVAGTAGGGIALSLDHGRTWKTTNDGLFAFQVQTLQANTTALTAGGSGGVYMRDLSNGDWSPLRPPGYFVTALSLAGSDIFIGAQGSGLHVSNDAGVSWHVAGLPPGPISQVAASSAGATAYTVLVASNFIYRSVDRGSTFSRASGMAGNDVRSFSFSPGFTRDSIVFAATLAHGMYRSSDGGVSWQSISDGLPNAPIMSVFASPSFEQNRTVFAATAGNGVYMSTTGGDMWSPMSPSVPDGVVDAVASTQSGQLLAGTEHGVFLYSGTGWSHLGNGWDGYVSQLLDSVVAGTEHLYAGTIGQGVWEISLGAATALPTSPPNSRSDPAATPSPSASATAPPSATATPTVTRRTTVSRPWVRLHAEPSPASARRPALVTVNGPANAHLDLVLTSPGWKRSFAGSLGRDGTKVFGFIAPTKRIAVAASVSIHGRTATASLTILIKGS